MPAEKTVASDGLEKVVAPAEVTSIEKLNFTDLYVDLSDGDPTPTRYRIGPNPERIIGNLEVSEQLDEQISSLRHSINGELSSGRIKGTLTLFGMRLRYMISDTVSGNWVALRRIELVPPELDELNFTNEAETLLKGWSANRGLVLVGGATGAGKTTTAVASYRWAVGRGGTGLALESPPEYLLQGAIGNVGFSFQREIEDDTEWGPAIQQALRWRPKVIFIGEILSPECAHMVLRASGSGHLIISTIHGGSVAETASNLLRLAEANLGNAARSLMADNLVGIVHQTLGRRGPNANILDGKDTTKTKEIRALIRDDKIDNLRQLVTAYNP